MTTSIWRQGYSVLITSTCTEGCRDEVKWWNTSFWSNSYLLQLRNWLQMYIQNFLPTSHVNEFWEFCFCSFNAAWQSQSSNNMKKWLQMYLQNYHPLTHENDCWSVLSVLHWMLHVEANQMLYIESSNESSDESKRWLWTLTEWIPVCCGIKSEGHLFSNFKS